MGNKVVFDWKDIYCIVKSIMWCWEVYLLCVSMCKCIIVCVN